MSWIFKDAGEQKPPNPKAVHKRAILFSLPFALMGIAALVLLLHDGLLGGLGKQKAIQLLSVIVVAAGFPALIFGITAKKNSLKAAQLKSPASESSEKPWLHRDDWAAGRIASSSRASVLMLWVFVIFWCAVSAAISLAVVPSELHRGNHAAWIALIFPVIGLAIFFFALNATFAWRKFGQSIFEMAAIPGSPGGTLEGEIQVRTRLQPQHGLHLRLTCVRRTTSGAGNNRSTSEKILWQGEKWLRADLPQTAMNATGIPIYFKLPDNQPESTPGRGDGIHWKLEASAKLRGPNFHAAFEVPVFKLPDGQAVTGSETDPTAPYQMSLDEMQNQIHSKIQINDLPDGKEFIFPAARNPGFASGASVFWLIWTGVVVLLVFKKAPFLFPLIFGAIDLLMAVFLFDLWLRRSCVVVTASQLKIQHSWLVFKKDHALNTADAANVRAEIGATAGHAAYYDLKIRTRDGREFTAAKNLNSKPEADWLVRQIADALKKSF